MIIFNERKRRGYREKFCTRKKTEMEIRDILSPLSKTEFWKMAAGRTGHCGK